MLHINVHVTIHYGIEETNLLHAWLDSNVLRFDSISYQEIRNRVFAFAKKTVGFRCVDLTSGNS